MRILGVDLGARRIGLAISDVTGTLARPLETVETTGSVRAALERVLPVVRRYATDENGLERVVVGLPVQLDGSDAPWTQRVRKFAAALARDAQAPVVLQDERLSSREAEARLAVDERDWRARKQRLDAAAAAIILQDYIDARTPEGQGPEVRES